MDADIARMMDKMRVQIELKESEKNDAIRNDHRHELIENSVTKSNALARAHYRFDIVEKRVMEALVSQLDPRLAQEKQLQDLELTAVDYAKTFNVSDKIAYRDLAKAVHDLMRVIITIRPEPENKKRKTEYTLMAKADYIENEGRIVCTFSPYITPDLIGLRQKFASYPLAQAVEFKSSYSWRLFEIIVSWSKDKKSTGGVLFGWFTISVDELRKQLGMPDSYNWSRFEQSLLVSTNELKQKAKIHTKIERIKTGRKITSLRFEFIEELQQDLLIGM